MFFDDYEEMREDDFREDPYDKDEDPEDEGDDFDESDPYDEDLIDGVGFADPGGNSSLRAATENNPRDQPCPTCGAEDVLTRIDVQRHYQCNRCSDKLERGGY